MSPDARPTTGRSRRELACEVAIVLLAAACVGACHAGLAGTNATLWAIWAPLTSVSVLASSRVLRASPLPPALVSMAVALPLASAIAQALLAPPAAHGLRGSLFDEARDGTLRVFVVAAVLGVEWIVAERPKLSSRDRHGGLLILIATAAICAVTLDASNLVTLVGRGTIASTLDLEAVHALRAFARATFGAAIEVALLVAVAGFTLAKTPSWRTGPSAVVLLLVASGLLLLPPRARDELVTNVDPLAVAVELGIDPPTETWTGSMWVGSAGTWRPSSPLLVLRDGAPAEYLERPHRGAPFRPAALPAMKTAKRGGWPDPEDHEVVVLADRHGRFQPFASGLEVLGQRRHDLWLAVAPDGWRSLGALRRLAERTETVALGVDPRPLFDGDAIPGEGSAPPDPLLGEMDAEGRTLGLIVADADARCVRLEAGIDAGRLRYSRHGDCGTVPLDDTPRSKLRRLELLRETAAVHVLLAPRPDATMDEVVGELGRLSVELASVMDERWRRSCPPPTLCEPHVSFETGSPLVWLTTARGAMLP